MNFADLRYRRPIAPTTGAAAWLIAALWFNVVMAIGRGLLVNNFTAHPRHRIGALCQHRREQFIKRPSAIGQTRHHRRCRAKLAGLAGATGSPRKVVSGCKRGEGTFEIAELLPRKAPEDSLTEIVPIRLTRAEREQCERAAALAQRKLTAWIRERAVKAAKREAKAG
ncbi:MAG: hypothetical protein KGL39_50640 [Patescibacteria group bacterium]|nr:hypothetical protein [Patescibacteria group bacterium]